MENAVWSGQTYVAADIAKNYELEKQILQARSRKELRCPDPDCPNPIVTYRKGEKKRPHFAHLANCNCDYAKFDKENSSLIHQVKDSLRENLTEQGFNVRVEAKILPHHYTHLLVYLPNDKKVAIELGTPNTTATKILELTSQYKDIGIAVKWVIVNHSPQLAKEENTFFIKRYLLNESNHKDVLMVGLNGIDVTQYIVDPNKYTYRGREIPSENYPQFYHKQANILELTFENDELTIPGFYNGYNEWLQKKHRAFEKKIADFKKNEEQWKARLVEYEVKQKQEEERNRRTKPKTDAECYEEIKDRFNQQTHAIVDSRGVRWVQCEICHEIKPSWEYWTYGGTNRINLGKCKECDEKRKDLT